MRSPLEWLRRRYYRLGRNPFLRHALPGHFYSPIPDLADVLAHRDTLFDTRVKTVTGIDSNAEGQLELLRVFSGYLAESPFKDAPGDGLRYGFVNNFFSYGDGIALYAMLRHFQPRRVIEIGSGFSSALMLDTNDRFCAKRIAFTFVEPFPKRLFSLLTADDRRRCEVIEDFVQNVPLDRFATLQARDILFIDSSHVAKTGSDVVYLLTHVLPSLNVGVLVHIHDILWPFEYCEEWLQVGRAWNEIYVLKAFLQFNPAFRIRFFNSYLALHHRDEFQRHLPLAMRYPGEGLWIEKIA